MQAEAHRSALLATQMQAEREQSSPCFPRPRLQPDVLARDLGQSPRAVGRPAPQGGGVMSPVKPLRAALYCREAGELRGSDTAKAIAVEAEDDVASPELPERDRPPLGAGQLELGRGLAPPERRHDGHSGDFRQGSQPPRGPRDEASPCDLPVDPLCCVVTDTRRHGHSTDLKVSRSIRSRLILLLPVLLAFAGCMVGPNYQRPKVSVSPSFGETGDPRLSAESTNYRDWWKAFNDPVLDRLIDRGRRDLPAVPAGRRVRPVQPHERSSRHRRFL